jgi:hypothetical protein
MARKSPRQPTVALEPLILTVRRQRVILDTDLARLYGVSTKVLNQAVKRNQHRFPDDFDCQLSADEVQHLRSKPRSQVIDATVDAPSWSQFVASSNRQRGAKYRPWAFTEHGVLMAANVLRSDRAVEMSVFVVRAFVRLREQIAANQAILKRLAEIDRTLLAHDTALHDLYQKLLPLLQPPPQPPRRRIGFRADDSSCRRHEKCLLTYRLIARPSTASAASLIVSGSVGWA